MPINRTESDAATLHEIFQGEVVYQSPLFQRHFVWGEKQINALWDDIDKVLEESSPSTFLGALVLKAYQTRSGRQPQGFWIIDGQQRLTTFYLLIVACSYKAVRLDDQEIAEDWVKTYLLQTQSSFRNHPKIFPTIPDLGQFKEILRFIEEFGPIVPEGVTSESEGQLEYVFQRHIEEIEKRIKLEEDESKDELEIMFNTIMDKIEFVQIILSPNHDANEVFNRLNDAGQPLEIIDLVRNEVFTLLKDDLEQASNIYNTEWLEFENSFNQGTSAILKKKSENLRNGYFYPFGLIKKSNVTKANIFNVLSKQWRDSISGMESRDAAKEIIDDLNKYVSPYLTLAEPSKPNRVSEEFWERVLRLHRMPVPVALYPYTMKLFKRLFDGEISEEVTKNVLEIIESFFVRRAFLGLEPTGLHKIFKDLWSKAGADPSQVKANIISSTVEFPNDDRFEEKVKNSDLYHRKLCRYVLGEYERSFTRGDILETFPDITADHLMPQKRTGDWKKNFSEEDHDSLIHTWANLVPLSNKANAEKGTNNWSEVKENLVNETVFKSTRTVLMNNQDWTKESINSRSNVLATWAIERWPK